MKSDIPRQVAIFDKNREWALAARLVLEQSSYVADAETESFESFVQMLEKAAYLIGVVNIDSLTNIDVQLKQVHDNHPGCRWLLTGERSGPEVDRLLRPPIQIADGFLNKTDYLTAALPELCDQLVHTRLSIPKNLEIVLPDSFNDLVEKYAHEARYTGEEHGLRMSSKLIREEFCIILGSMFCPDERGEQVLAHRVMVESLKMGFGAAFLFKITPELLIDVKAPKSAVLKFGPRTEMRDEARHYERFVEWFLTVDQTVRLIAHKEFSRFGAILYSFPRDVTSGYTDFSEYMRKHPAADSVKIIDRMFAPANKHWLDVNGNKHLSARDQSFQWYYLTTVLQSTPYDMRVKHFDDQFVKYASNLTRKAKMDSVVEQTGDKLTFPLISESVPDPLAYLQKPLVKQIRMSIVHGDLHANNILISEEDRRYFFIDFYHTDFGHVFNDFVALEMSARYDILMSRQLPDNERLVVSEDQYKAAEKATQKETEIAALLERDADGIKQMLRLEAAIIKKSVFGKEPRDPILTNDERLAKVFEIVCAIRRKAFENFSEDVLSYYQAVVYRALKTLKYWYPLGVRMFYLVMAGRYVQLLDAGRIAEPRPSSEEAACK
jgi:hypothetical protein